MLMGEVRAEQIMSALAPEVRDSLSAEQETAIRAAAELDAWDRHPVDLRLSLPTPFGRIYIAMVAGRERRSAARRAIDRRQRPLLTTGNVLVVAGVLGLLAWAVFGF